MAIVKFILDILIILLLLRLLIRPNEAFFHPIYRLIYRITDPVLTPSRYLTGTPNQGVLITVLGLVVIRGILYMTSNLAAVGLRKMGYIAGGPLSAAAGIGVSFIELFQLLFQVYMVIWIISAISGRGHGTSMIHMMARAFLPVDTALRWAGISRSRFHLASFLFLWILFALLYTAFKFPLVLSVVPGPLAVLEGLVKGLLLMVGLFPFPGFFSLVIIAGALLSWVGPDPYNPVVQAIYGISEPLLAPFRRFVPTIAGFDISPIIALLAFQVLGALAFELIRGFMRIL